MIKLATEKNRLDIDKYQGDNQVVMIRYKQKTKLQQIINKE